MISKQKTPKTKFERDIITGMIVSKSFLKKINSVYDRYPMSPLTVSFTRLVAEWCLEYYQNHEDCPGKHIYDIFYTRKKRLTDTKADLISEFLSSLSEEYENKEIFNENYLIKQADEYFRLRHAEHFRNKLTDAITRDDIDQAEKIISDYNRISRSENTGVDPLGDSDFLEEVFAENNKDFLFKFSGDFGKLLGNLEREQLIAVLGKEGAGKSWWLQEFAVQSINNGFSAVLVSAELSDKMMTKRLHMNLNSLPIQTREILIPEFDCKKNQENNCRMRGRTCDVEFETDGIPPDWDMREFRGKDRMEFNPPIPEGYVPCTYCKGNFKFEPTSFLTIENKTGITATKAIRKGRSLLRSKFKGKKLKFIQFPSRTKTVKDLETQLDNWEAQEGFIPDVIIIDYADKLISKDMRLNYRHQINDIWEDCKALAQKRKCLVVTASQTNTSRKGANKNIGESDFAEDIRKKALVDKAMTHNQTDREKKDCIARINIIKERDAMFNTSVSVMVLQALGIGNPLVDSCRILKNNKKEGEE